MTTHSNRYNPAPSEGHKSALWIVEIPMVSRRTEPTNHLYRGAVYTPAAQTDIRKTLAQFGFAFGGKS